MGIANRSKASISSLFAASSLQSAGPFPRYLLRQRHSYRPVRTSERRPRINDQIRVPEVLLVSEEGVAEKLPIAEAIARAQATGYDLIEVSPKAVPPVVRIDDIGKYMYQIQKKAQKQKAGSKQVEVKILKFGFRTDKHDIDRLAERAREFFTERHLVKFMVRLRGRELANKDYAIEKMKALLASLADVSDLEQEIKRQGDQFIAILRPKK